MSAVVYQGLSRNPASMSVRRSFSGLWCEDFGDVCGCAGRAAADRRMGKVQDGSNCGLGWWAACKQWATSLFVLNCAAAGVGCGISRCSASMSAFCWS